MASLKSLVACMLLAVPVGLLGCVSEFVVQCAAKHVRDRTPQAALEPGGFGWGEVEPLPLAAKVGRNQLVFHLKAADGF